MSFFVELSKKDVIEFVEELASNKSVESVTVDFENMKKGGRLARRMVGPWLVDLSIIDYKCDKLIIAKVTFKLVKHIASSADAIMAMKTITERDPHFLKDKEEYYVFCFSKIKNIFITLDTYFSKCSGVLKGKDEPVRVW